MDADVIAATWLRAASLGLVGTMVLVACGASPEPTGPPGGTASAPHPLPSGAPAAADVPSWSTGSWIPSADGIGRAGSTTITWDAAATVDRVQRVEGSTTLTAAELVFPDGQVVVMDVDQDGAASALFPSRSASTAVLNVTSSSESGDQDLLGWSVDSVSPPSASPSAPPVPTAGPLPLEPAPEVVLDGPAAVSDLTVTASSNQGAAALVVDGEVALGEAGGAWTAARGDDTPSIRITFAGPRRLASVLVLGLVQSVYDPGHLSDAPLHGDLVFDDGSRVGVDGISGATDEATVIAFAPRTTSSVLFELRRTLAGASLGLRELAVYDRGVTPPRWGDDVGPTYSVTAPTAVSCPAATSPTGTGPVLQLVCPAIGTAVDGTAAVTVRAQYPVGSQLVARAWRATAPTRGSVEIVASATVGSDGLARFSFSTAQLAHGPVGVQIRLASATSTSSPTVQAQLFNRGGVVLDDSGHAPPGMTLQWDEDFTAPLSVSRWGQGSTYAAVKPEFWGGSEFGDAVLADPARGSQGLATLESDYLRVRVSSLGGASDPAGSGRTHTSGLLSSSRVGGSGFAAQNGYFEARILSPGGVGTWPAFWMLDTEGSVDHTAQQAEVDAVELYGHNTLGSCHTVHNWRVDAPTDPAACPDPNGFADSSLAWHTYGVQIRQGGADFYIDGQWVASRNGMLNGDRPFFFMLNLALGGGWPVDLSPTNETADLYVDWVRVYT